MDYFQIKNWNKFQHFGGAALNTGIPAWIKLFVSLLDVYMFCKLTDLEKCHLILIWLFAARMHNRIPNDPDWLKKQINATEDMHETVSKLIDYGFLEIVSEINPAIYRSEDTLYTVNEETQNTLSSRREEKREEENRREEKRKEEGIRPPDHSIIKINVTDISESLATPEFVEAWEKFLKHRKEIGKPLKTTGELAALEKLSKFSPAIATQTIIESISNGWQGLFPEKIQSASNGAQQHQKKSTPLVEAFKGVNPGHDWVDRIDPDFYRTHKKERL